MTKATNQTKPVLIKAVEQELTECICNDFSDTYDAVIESVAHDRCLEEEELKKMLTGNFEVSFTYKE